MPHETNSIMAKELKTIYIDEIARQTNTMIERAHKKHKSFNAYCIFVEGDHWHALVPNYKNEKERQKETRRLMDVLIQNERLCNAFAEFVCPPARFFERKAKKEQKETPAKD